MTDITPELLESLKKDFEKRYNKSSLIKSLSAKIKNNTATYEDAYRYAVEVGNIRAKTFKSISGAMLPDGRMYFNIADRILNDTLKDNHLLATGYAESVQKIYNDNSSIKVATKKAALDKDRIKGLVDRISSELDFDKVSWILGEPVINFTQNSVDETIKANADFQNDAGFNVMITRTSEAKCCEWCTNLEGTYTYPDNAPGEIFARHDNCRCVVEYNNRKLIAYKSKSGKSNTFR